MTRQTFSTGAYDAFGYDSRNRQTSVDHKKSDNSLISGESYVYDDAGNLTSATKGSVTTSYTYDNIDQLLTESRTGYSATYTYDANGNRASKTLNSSTDTYTCDDADKLTSITNGGVTVKSYTYDSAGRTHTVTTSAGTTTLDYDYEGRITTITYPNSSTNTFSYNGLDTRVGKVDSAGTSTYKRDGAGVTAPVLTDGSAAYTPGISERRSSTSKFYGTDRLGTNALETDSTQATTATKLYDAFGMLVSSTGSSASPFGFAGRFGYQEDGDSGLKLLGHRYYDASTGRFITRDPAKSGRNWYSYASNSPLRHIDPNGHNFYDAWLSVGTWIDDNLMGGAVADAGGAYGDWQSGTGSGWTAAGKGLKAFGMIAVLAVALADGAGEVGAGEAGLEGGLEGVGEGGLEGAGEGGLEGGAGEGGEGAGGCFTAGTRIAMADGSSQAIERIKPGDRVLTRDQGAQERASAGIGTVSRTFVHPHQGSILLRFEDGSTVHTTPEHPFYVHTKGFTHAGDLRVGDSITEDGKSVDRVAAVVRLTATETVYNFEVAGSHTYFVRAGGAWLWVHNACSRPSKMDRDPNKPPGVDVHGGKTNVPPGTDHVHYGDGPTWHSDGTVGHSGAPGPLPKDWPNAVKDWIEKHGWPRP